MRYLRCLSVGIMIISLGLGITGCKGPTDDPAPSQNADLSALTVSAGSLAPAFSASRTEYTVLVGNGVESITVTGTASDGGAKLSANNGTAQSLNVGANPIQIVVTAADGSTKKTYVVTVTRSGATDPNDPSDKANASLSSLTVTAGTLKPAFSSTVTEYSVDVPSTTDSITVTGVATGTNASVGGASGVATALSGGANTIQIVVTAADGTTKKTYTVTVNRAKDASDPSNADLSALSCYPGILVPAFSPSVTAYTAIVGRNESSAQVSGTCANAGATLGGDNATPKIIDFGENLFKVIVTAPDKTTVKTYTVTVTRSNDTTPPKLTGFTLSTASVDSSMGDVTVGGTITAEDENGIRYVGLDFKCPDGGQNSKLTRRESECTATKAVYDWSVTVKKGSRGGKWYTEYAYIRDCCDNVAEPSLSGYQNSFMDTAPEGDKTPPVLLGFTLSPTEIDSSKGDAIVGGTVTAEDPSGVRYVSLNFNGPEGWRNATLVKRENGSTATKAVYDWSVTVKKGSRGGKWFVASLEMGDEPLNRVSPSLAGYTTSFMDNAPEGDQSPPVLLSFTLSPTVIDSSKGDVTVGGTVTAEDPSGVRYLSLDFRGPAGGRNAKVVKRAGGSGDTKAVFDWTITVTKGTIGGTWNVSLFELGDELLNRGNPSLTGYVTSFTDNAPSE